MTDSVFEELQINANAPAPLFKCVHCNAVMDARHIALLSRTLPGEPFDAWCVGCAYELVSRAREGYELLLHTN